MNGQTPGHCVISSGSQPLITRRGCEEICEPPPRLEDSKTLAECGIEPGTQIQLVVHCEITVFVRTMTGKRLPVKVPSDASVELLMSRLEEEVSPESALLFSGRRVVGKICDYGIKEGNELVACVRHRIQ